MPLRTDIPKSIRRRQRTDSPIGRKKEWSGMPRPNDSRPSWHGGESGYRVLMQAPAKGHAPRTTSILGRKPEAPGLFNLVEVLAVHSFDVEVRHDQLPASTVSERQGLCRQRWAHLPGIIIRAQIG